MDDSLYEAFRTYFELVQVELRNSKLKPRVKKHLTYFLRADQELEEFEKRDEFEKLDRETCKISSPLSGDSFSRANAIKNFFRRSGLYLDIVKEKRISIDVFFENYLQAFEKSEIQITYLIPLSLVHFNDRSTLDFGSFQIRHFDAQELREFSGQVINDIFYQDAKIPTEDLFYIPFICVTESIDSSKNRVHKNGQPSLDETDLVGVEYTQYPKPVELALKQLILFGWESKLILDLRFDIESSPTIIGENEKRYWQGFETPFIIKINNNLLSRPYRTPDVSGLRLIKWFEPELNQHITSPKAAWSFTSEEIDRLKDFIQEIGHILTILKPYKETWQFIDTALGFLLKAFFAKGRDQLLWHITSIEALLGEKKETEGVTNIIRRRVSLICGKTKNDRKKIRKKITELYNFRSALVHGKSSDKRDVYVGHLYNARLYARQALLWFLNCLKEIAGQMGKESDVKEIPTQEDILKFIDLNKRSRVSQAKLNDILPDNDEFPYIRNWLK